MSFLKNNFVHFQERSKVLWFSSTANYVILSLDMITNYDEAVEQNKRLVAEAFRVTQANK